MEQLNAGVGTKGGVPRRTIVKGAAWSVPVIAAAMAVPMASASGEGISGTSPIPSGVCSAVGDIAITVTSVVLGTPVTVTLPTGFTWSDNSSGSKVLLTDANGNVTVTGINGPSKPGIYTVVASVASGTGTISTTIPVSVTGTWIGSSTGGGASHYIYTNPTSVTGLGPTSCVAYCIEHDYSSKANKVGYVGDGSSFVGDNNFSNGIANVSNGMLGASASFTAAQVQAKVEWILRHGSPAQSLSALEAAAGVPASTGLTVKDVMEATQYAIWSYTDLSYVDANWPFADYNSTPGATQSPRYEAEKAVFTYLANGAWNDTATAPSSCLKVVSSADTECTTPAPGKTGHLQTLAMVCDCV